MAPRHHHRHRRVANDSNATLLEALVEAGENVWRKLHLFAIGLLHLLFSSDKQWLNQLQQCERDLTTTNEEKEEEEELLGSTTSDDQMQMQIPQQRKVKRIIFVRHAESEWNVVFNRGMHWRVLVHFVRACVREWLMLPTQHSIFIDSPLSRRGVRQAKELFDDVSNGQIQDLECGGSGTAKSAEKATVLRYLSCPLPDSIIVTSNLRRAIDTARIASAARLELPNQKIHVLSSLQEIGRNIDTLTISDAYAIKPQVLSSALRIEKGREDLFNLKESHGNKAVLGCGRTRLEAFAKWAMGQDEDVLVVYGHSLWFRAFCREYFPSGVENDAKRNKLANCGVVSFAFEERSVAVKSASATAPELFGPHVRKEHQIIPESFLFVR